MGSPCVWLARPEKQPLSRSANGLGRTALFTRTTRARIGKSAWRIWGGHNTVSVNELPLAACQPACLLYYCKRQEQILLDNIVCHVAAESGFNGTT